MTNDELKILEEVIAFANGKVHTLHMDTQVRKAKHIVERELNLKHLERIIPKFNEEEEK